MVIGFPILTELATAFGWRWAVASLLVPVALLTAGASLLPQRELGGRRTGLVADYLARYRHVLGHAEVNWLLAVNLLRNLAWTAPLIYGVVIWGELFHLSLRGYGWMSSLAGVVYFVGSNLAPALIRRSSAFRAFLAAAALQVVTSAGFALAVGHLTAALAAYCGLVFAGGMAAVAVNVMMQDVLPESRGAVLSLSGTMSQSGSALGGALGGLILATLGAVVIAPLINLLMPAAVLAGWLSVRRPAPLAEPIEQAEPAIV